MRLREVQWMQEAGKLSEAVIEPCDQGNGWQLDFHDTHGGHMILTNENGHIRLFHNVDSATRVAQDVGVGQVRISEPF